MLFNRSRAEFSTSSGHGALTRAPPCSDRSTGSARAEKKKKRSMEMSEETEAETGPWIRRRRDGSHG